MAGSISAIGIGSGVDFGDIHDKLKKAETDAMMKRPTAQLAKNTTQQKDLGALKTLLSAFKVSTQSMIDDDTYAKRKVDLSGKSISIDAGKGVGKSNFKIDVKNLATRDIYQSNAVGGEDDAVFANLMAVAAPTNGGTDGGGGLVADKASIGIKIGSAKFSINLDSSDSLYSIVDKINNATNLNAALSSDGQKKDYAANHLHVKALKVSKSEFKLMVSSAKTGADAQIQFSVEGKDAGEKLKSLAFLKKLGFESADMTGREEKLKTAQAAEAAVAAAQKTLSEAQKAVEEAKTASASSTSGNVETGSEQKKVEAEKKVEEAKKALEDAQKTAESKAAEALTPEEKAAAAAEKVVDTKKKMEDANKEVEAAKAKLEAVKSKAHEATPTPAARSASTSSTTTTETTTSTAETSEEVKKAEAEVKAAEEAKTKATAAVKTAEEAEVKAKEEAKKAAEEAKAAALAAAKEAAKPEADKTPVKEGERDYSKNHISFGQDAHLMYEGIEITRSENEFKDLILGANIKLLEAGATNVNISEDDSEIKKGMQEFIKTYNDLINNLNVATDYNADKKQGGTFLGVSEISNISREMARLVNMDKNGQSLAGYGVEMNKNGLLTFKENVFDAAMKKDAEKVIAFFKGSITYKENTIHGAGLKENDIKGLALKPGDMKINGVEIKFSEENRVKIQEGNVNKTDYALMLMQAIRDADTGVRVRLNQNGGISLFTKDGGEIDIDGDSDVLAKLGLSVYNVPANSYKDAGIFDEFKRMMDNTIGSKGSVTKYEKTLEKESKDLTNQKETLQKELEAKYDQLAKRFSAFDQMIAKLKRQEQHLQAMINAELAKKN